MKNKYEFEPVKHIHTLDGKPLMGVTTVLQVIAKPFLLQWAANQAVDYIDSYIHSKNWNTLDEINWETLLKEARTAHRRKKESAGDWGTVVHKKIELWIKDKKEYSVDEVIEILNKEKRKKKIVLTEEEKKMVDVDFALFREWATENKVEFLESEKHVWSKELWIGGIVDMVIMMDGKKYIADIKTSSGIYNEAFFQMGAYNMCLEEMGEHKDVEGYLVINLKKDGKMDLKMAMDMEFNKQAFKAALALHKIIKSLE